MSKRMLIDANHPEETRVVVLDGQKVEEFDFEAASKRPLKGNIYLAKITRVEPSLQAAFVEYGGNRHGFLALSEIHPDYYQIPIADRQALLAEQEAEARGGTDEDVEAVETASVPARESAAEAAAFTDDSQDAMEVSAGGSRDEPKPPETESTGVPQHGLESEHGNNIAETDTKDGWESISGSAPKSHSDDLDVDGEAERSEAAEPAAAQSKPLQSKRPPQRWTRRRHYKIQEVIKRRQVILVQVVKEERGNKGAALTTYLSLAGRYCVLMPNTPRGGGISRKITSVVDRNRLKSAAQTLELPEGMGLIIRTAGENRTKAEIKRDYEYLLRMWDTIRELTLRSNAPACVYEEGDLVKRAIRDLYNKDVSEILVEGDNGYRNAKDFMRMLMPSHAKNVKPYKEPVPLFQSYQIEAQLDSMFSPTVTLRSGGYIVINQTEALVSIDVNSGRATREHSIEETAHKTNLEAAEEIARQLRLRDLAGLIVIDFIDMEDAHNDRNVEKRLRDCTKNDRARVQIGKISQFGLLEMSRQRLRAGVVAGSTVPCPHCGGQGIVRSVESTALRLLRALEEESQRQRASGLNVRVATEVAIYTLNQKRSELARIETEYGLSIQLEAKDGIQAGTFEIDRLGQKAPEELPKTFPGAGPVLVEVAARPAPLDVAMPLVRDTGSVEPRDASPVGEGGGRRRRRRRRRGRDRTQPLPEHTPVGKLGGGVSVLDAGGPPASTFELSPMGDRGPAMLGDVNARQGQPGSAPETSSEGTRKKRRRRRGRRSSRTDAAAPLETQSQEREREFPADRVVTGATLPMPVEQLDADVSALAPNAPSAPLWSLSPQPDRESPPTPDGRVLRAEPSGNETARPETAEEPGARQPTRKGWWQRPFRARE